MISIHSTTSGEPTQKMLRRAYFVFCIVQYECCGAGRSGETLREKDSVHIGIVNEITHAPG